MTTLLLARHILHTIARQRTRTLMLWVALAGALGVVVGLLSFVSSINDSFAARGRAVRGISDAQVQAVGHSTLGRALVRRLERVEGTRHAVAVTQQRVTVRSRHHSVVATAYGIDRRARLLRSAMQRELRVTVPRRPQNGGLSLSTELARRLGVEKGSRLRLFAFQRSPRIRVARVVHVRKSLEEVIALPRSTLERLSGSPGRPNLVYLRRRDSGPVPFERWQRRVRRLLPENAALTTAAAEQRELDHVLDLTVRSYTYLFGAVVLTIAGLLMYVLQLMRMLERQEDAGLVRALGSRWMPLARAEVLALAVLLAAALVPGTLVGRLLAGYLAAQLPTYLTDVFNFELQVEVKAGVVAAAAALALAIGALATVGALATTRRPVADQLGRAPQAGATATARMSGGAALSMTVLGGTGFALGLVLAQQGSYVTAAVLMLLSLALATPGLTALLLRALGRAVRREGPTLLVARSALEAYQRRVAFSAAIVALAVAAVVQLQLLDHALGSRTDDVTGTYRPDAQRVVASDDAFFSVPMRQEYVRQVLREPAPRYAQPVATGFTSYRGKRILVFALDARRAGRLFRGGKHLAASLPALRRHRRGVLISTHLAAWSGLGRGDRIRIRTPSGARAMRIAGVVDDMSWPSGTVYLDFARYRKLYRTTAINALALKGPGHLRRQRLERLRPLHAISGRTLADRIHGQVDRIARTILAMRFITVLAALVAVGGIFAASVFARLREWGVLRAIGMRGWGLMRPLALEAFLVMATGVALGLVGGIVSFRGPVLWFMDGNGIPVSGELATAPLVGVAAGAVLAGTLAAVVPGWLVARTRLASALAYE